MPASLFGLSQEPGEERNLVAGEPSRAEVMRLLLRELSGVPSYPGARPGVAEERLRALGYLRRVRGQHAGRGEGDGGLS